MAESFSRGDLRELLKRLDSADTNWESFSTRYLPGLLFHLKDGDLEKPIRSIQTVSVYPDDEAGKEPPTLQALIQETTEYLRESTYFRGSKQEEAFDYYLENLNLNQNIQDIETYIRKLIQLARIDSPEQAPKSWQEEAAEIFQQWLSRQQPLLQNRYQELLKWENEFATPTQSPLPTVEQQARIQQIEVLSKQYRANQLNSSEVEQAYQQNQQLKEAERQAQDIFQQELKKSLESVYENYSKYSSFLFPSDWLDLTQKHLNEKQHFASFLANTFQPTVIEWAAFTVRLTLPQIQPALEEGYLPALEQLGREEYVPKFQAVLKQQSESYQEEVQRILSGGVTVSDKPSTAAPPASESDTSGSVSETTSDGGSSVVGGSNVLRTTQSTLETPAEATPRSTGRPTIRDVGNIGRLQENLINLAMHDLQRRFETDPEIQAFCSRQGISVATLVDEQRGAVRELIWAQMLSSGGLTGKLPAAVLAKMWVDASKVVYAEMDLATDPTKTTPISYTEIMSEEVRPEDIQQTQQIFEAGNFDLETADTLLYNISHNDHYLETVKEVAEEISVKREEVLQQIVEDATDSLQAKNKFGGREARLQLTPDQEFLLQYTLRDQLQLLHEANIDFQSLVQQLPEKDRGELLQLLKKATDSSRSGELVFNKLELKRFDELMQQATPAWYAIREQAPEVAALFYGKETVDSALQVKGDLQVNVAEALDVVLQQLPPERQQKVIENLQQMELTGPAFEPVRLALQNNQDGVAHVLSHLENNPAGANANVFGQYAALAQQQSVDRQQGKRIITSQLPTLSSTGGKASAPTTSGKTKQGSGSVTLEQRAAVAQLIFFEDLRNAQGGKLSSQDIAAMRALEIVLYGTYVTSDPSAVFMSTSVPILEEPVSAFPDDFFDDGGSYGEYADHYSSSVARDQANSVYKRSARLQNAQTAANMAKAFASGGYVGLAMALAKDPRVRKALQFGVVGAGALAGYQAYQMIKPFLEALKYANYAKNFVETGFNMAKGAFNNVFGGGGGGGSFNPAVSNMANAVKDAAAAQSATTNSATSQLTSGINSTLGNTANAINATSAQLVALNTSAAVVAGGVLGPFSLIMIFTIIVITVIGGSMNDIPFGEGLYTPGGQVSGQVCWPTDGQITQLNTRTQLGPGEHLTMPTGTAYDIGAPNGTEVYAPFSGTYMFYPSGTGPYAGGEGGGYGHYAVIQGDNGITTILAHLQDTAIESGIRVGASELIAYSDNSGNSSGPHVHWEVLGVVIDEIAPDQPVRLWQNVSHTSCVGSDDVDPVEGVDCITFAEDGWGEADRAMMVKQLGTLKSEFPEYLNNICNAVGGDIVLKREPELAIGSYKARANGGNLGQIIFYDVLFDEDGPAGVLYTLSHELVHQWSDASGLLYTFEDVVYGTYDSAAEEEPSPYDFYSATQSRVGYARLEETLAESAAWYIQYKLGNSHSRRPYTTYGNQGTEYYRFYEFARDYMFSE